MHDHCRKRFLRGFREENRKKKLEATGNQESTTSLRTDFDAVKAYIRNVIIGENKVVSTKILQSIYGYTPYSNDDKRSRHKLKNKIINEFPDTLQFVQPGGQCAEVVFSKSIFDEKMMPSFDPNSNIISVSKQLRKDIITFCKSVPGHKWPPTFDSLTGEYGKPPESVQLFLKHLLTSEKNKERHSISANRFVYIRLHP
uniref:Uncharacterized protein n=2 Tax=Clytia hemisphaerica TaxID=252671 RepID=A0A7M5V7L0_9CNID